LEGNTLLALSTAWNVKRYESGKSLVEEIIDLGLSAIELNVEITERMLDEILILCKKGKIKIVSLHNFCPKLTNVLSGRSLMGAYLLSSPDGEERKKAVELTKRTVKFAHLLNAQAVIIHVGEVAIESHTKEIFDYCAQGKRALCKQLLSEVLRQREKEKAVYFSNALNSLEEISNYSQRFNIKLGIENRYFHHEIPNFEEIRLILEHFPDRNVYYWHDTGHARVVQKLGLVDSDESFLKEYSDKLLGIHLHDIIGFSDHRSPGIGEINFEITSSYLDHHTIKVLEPHDISSREDVIASLSYLQNLGIV
jgi:sugar phosphate isomerase/epimerase